MSHKVTIYTFVATCVLLASLISGRSCHVKSVFAQAPQVADQRKDAPTLNAEAYALIAEMKYAAAIAKAKLAVEKDPDFGEAQKNLALAYCDSGLVSEALAPAQKAIKLSPNLDKAHYVLGKILFKLRRFGESITQFQDAVRINPKYDKAYFLMGRSYDLSNKLEDARLALDRASQLKPDNVDYRRVRDYVAAYARQQESQTRIPIIVSTDGLTYEDATWVYSGIFYEALIHHDFDLIERAAAAARDSKEKLPGGIWKLQLIYSLLNMPLEATSDYEWNEHIELLKKWTEAKPSSLTAKVALAEGYVSFAWKARGNGFANTVSDQNWDLFNERLARGRDILFSARGQRVCPMWYSVMQQIAQGEGWDNAAYERLFTDAVQHEPTWYQYYKLKAIFLLPRWHGKPGELETYINGLSLRTGRTDNAMLYFLVNEYAARYDQNEKLKHGSSYELTKQGFLDLQKAYGATVQDVNWACFKALQSNDRSFARELFAELKDNADLYVWGSKETFDAAKSFAELK